MSALAASPSRQLTLPHGFAVSGLLHAFLAAPLLILAMFLAPVHPPEPPMLAVDLHSLLPESTAPAAEPPPPQAPPPPEQPTAEPPLKVTQPVKIPKAIKPKPAPTPARVPDTLAQAPAAPAVADQAPPQPVQSDADAALRVYVSQLKRKLMQTLSASQEVRKAGLDGIVTVGFTVDADGRLLTDTLRVVRSSGSPVLDRNALTIAAATPLDPPPRQISVTIDMRFQQ